MDITTDCPLNDLVSRASSPSVRIDLARIRSNARSIAAQTGVDLIAVVKADAYGCGASRVAASLAELVTGFYVFSFEEAVEAGLWQVSGKPTIALICESTDPSDYLAHRVHPAVWDAERARMLRKARPVVSVDTGMTRFACPADRVPSVIDAGGCEEAMTHGVTLAHARALVEALPPGFPRKHAAATALLPEPEAWLDAVRPGLALYEGAVTVTSPIVEIRRSSGPIGYTGFRAPIHGLILAGYTNGLRVGPCRIGEREQQVLEVGMQSAYVSLSGHEKVGDRVELLSPQLSPARIAMAWKTSPQEVLTRLTAAGSRHWVE
jgi:alanine racemase